MLGFTGTLGTKRIGRMFPYRPLLVSSLRITWLKRVTLAWPVIIPALAPSLDRSLKEDRSLCPVRALRYYLDKTKDLRSGKELVFVSFRKSFQKDIVPATISSWIKQTIVLCYQMSDQQAQQLHQVRAHDVRGIQSLSGGVFP